MRRGTPKFRLVDTSAVVQEIRSRIPFHPGRPLPISAPLLVVRVEIESRDGKRAVGFASDGLLAHWFDRSPEKNYGQKVDDQLNAFRAARQVYLNAGVTPLAAVEIWEGAHEPLRQECERRGIDARTACFGGSFLERAIIDALCRLRQVSFFEALRSDLLGLPTQKMLPREPLREIHCRHTVRLGDPLTRGEIRAEDRLDDGLPQALEDDIDSYGLTHFKVKVSGEHDRDVERLSRIAVLIQQRCREGYTITLDGSEEYAEPDALERLIETLRGRPYGVELMDSVLHIEQPFPRESALSPPVASKVARLSAIKPLLIDESDDQLDSFQRAAQLGYLGVSHRNSKGLFKSLRNRAWMLESNRQRTKQKLPLLFQAGDDLACTPVLPLQQELAFLAALGIDFAERNGHHYFRGLDHLPPAEATSASAAHTDLYEEREASVFLRIQNGVVSVHSLEAPGFGYSATIAFEGRRPLEEWALDRLDEKTPHA